MDAAGVEACEGWLFSSLFAPCRAAASFLAADYFGIEPEPPKFAEKSRKLDFGAAVHHDGESVPFGDCTGLMVDYAKLQPEVLCTNACSLLCVVHCVLWPPEESTMST